MKLIQFTDLRGQPVSLNPDSVVRVRGATTDRYEVGAKTVIDFIGGKQAVKEEYLEVYSRLTS